MYVYATEANMLCELCCAHFHISPWVGIYFLIDRFTHASAQKSTTKYTFAKIDSQYFSQLDLDIWNCGGKNAYSKINKIYNAISEEFASKSKNQHF